MGKARLLGFWFGFLLLFAQSEVAAQTMDSGRELGLLDPAMVAALAEGAAVNLRPPPGTFLVAPGSGMDLGQNRLVEPARILITAGLGVALGSMAAGFPLVRRTQREEYSQLSGEEDWRSTRRAAGVVGGMGAVAAGVGTGLLLSVPREERWLRSGRRWREWLPAIAGVAGAALGALVTTTVWGFESIDWGGMST
jgi:hypothetical protein